MPTNPLPIVSSQQIAQAVVRNQQAIADEIKAQANTVTDDPLRRAQIVNSFEEVAGELQKTAAPDNVLDTPRHAMASHLQSFVAQKAAEADQVDTTADVPVVRFSDDDLLEWIKTGFIGLFEGQDKFPWTTAPDDPDPLPADTDHLRVAVFGDWGTGAYGAPIIARSIVQDEFPFDLILHLGDTYYSGQANEVQNQLVNCFPYRDNTLHRSLNGNHEMYSGGKAYYQAITGGRFQQRASHFYVQNRYWTLIGLDTAYIDHDLPDEEFAWLERVLAAAGDRQVVLFSHHQPFSLLDQQGPKLVEKLSGHLKDRRILAWYWGHEHRCVVYDQHPTWGTFGRCVGHGGFPYYRDHLGTPSVDLEWKYLASSGDIPGGKILDGPNPYVTAAPAGYGPHGYMSLVFDGAQMREFVHRPDGVTIYTLSLTTSTAAVAGGGAQTQPTE